MYNLTRGQTALVWASILLFAAIYAALFTGAVHMWTADDMQPATSEQQASHSDSQELRARLDHLVETRSTDRFND